MYFSLACLFSIEERCQAVSISGSVPFVLELGGTAARQECQCVGAHRDLRSKHGCIVTPFVCMQSSSSSLLLLCSAWWTMYESDLRTFCCLGLNIDRTRING